MKYVIRRTSQYFSEKVPPVESAELVKVPLIRDIRTFRTTEAWLKQFPRDAEKAVSWGYTEDKLPYRVIENYYSVWMCEIEDLLEFVKEHGEIILSEPDRHLVGYEDVYCIEIYDDYRE